MSKLALLLLVLGTMAVLWQQAESKPFFLLSKNFFVLTTRGKWRVNPVKLRKLITFKSFLFF